jgi:hypothetical protein
VYLSNSPFHDGKNPEAIYDIAAYLFYPPEIHVEPVAYSGC